MKDHMVNSMEDSVKRVYCATDCEYKYSECATVNYIQERKESENVSTRSVVLHTLLHGSVLIEVADVSCSNCNEAILFDIEWEGLLSSSKNNFCTRELLYSWTYEVYGKGSTF